MNYNTYSESDMESETNFQQPTGKLSNNNNINNNGSNGGGNFVRNNSIKNDNNKQQQNKHHQSQAKSSNVRRRASDCSFYGLGETCDNISYYGVPLRGQKRGSLNGTGHGMSRSQSNKSSLSSSSSGDASSQSGSSTCSADDTTSTSSGPNLPYPGFAEYSFRYLSQEARPRNWCLQLITNP